MIGDDRIALSQNFDKTRRIWLRSFYGFNPEEAGYIGWSEEGRRDRMLNLIADGDLFLIYGANTSETARRNRARVLGFLQIKSGKIKDQDKSSPAAIKEKIARGWQDKWTFGIPVTRAWRVKEPVLIELIAPKTYRPEAGQAIAVWNPELQPEEIERALKIIVTEVQVFGEPPLPDTPMEVGRLGDVFHPSRAIPGSFGLRSAFYGDGPTYLYLAKFEGNWPAFVGRSSLADDKSVLVKIGISNDWRRRLSELNAGFPPAAVAKWTMQIISEPFGQREAAEAAEQLFKDKAEKTLQSLGGEFFCGKWSDAQSLFLNLPGVARFGPVD